VVENSELGFNTPASAKYL